MEIDRSDIGRYWYEVNMFCFSYMFSDELDFTRQIACDSKVLTELGILLLKD